MKKGKWNPPNSKLNRERGFKRRAFVSKEETIKAEARIISKAKLARKSKKKKEREDRYYKIQNEFLHGKNCAICEAVKGHIVPAIEVHHIAGRGGDLMFDVTNFLPTCRQCREWPHRNPIEASRLGFMPKSIADRVETFSKLKGAQVFVTS